MMFRIAGLACFALCLAGCATEEESQLPVMADGHEGHDHGDHAHAETVGEAFHELTELYTTVKTAFAADDSDTAHGPMHEVGHVLQEVKELASKSELTAEAKATVDQQVEILMDAYGDVDNTMHGKDGSLYSEVSDKVDAAMAALKTALGELAEHDGDHDHGDHDHGDHDHDGEDHDDHDHKEGDHDDHDHDEKK
ncbi:MAG: hypothetical protein ABJZ55_18230 [Fuerstiella sp.]